MVSGAENGPPNKLRNIDSSVAEVDKIILRTLCQQDGSGIVLTETDKSILTVCLENSSQIITSALVKSY